MNPKRLIINADDCNLTPGVTRGIFLAHDQGMVTSTTLLINLPLEEKTVKEIKKRKHLGLGLHLNVTLSTPLNRTSKVPSLVNPEGRFRRPPDYLKKMPSVKEVIREYDAQIRLFQKRFGIKPDHLDTHHHLHDFPVFFSALSHAAKKWKVPVRRSRIFRLAEYASKVAGLQTTDFLFGNLEAHSFWQPDSFLGVVENLPEGTSEIACHPGFCDAELLAISSMRESREKERKLFSDRNLRKRISHLAIELIRFSEI